MPEPYNNREIDARFDRVDDNLKLILEQTTKHNGRLTRLERWFIVVATATVVIGATKPELISWVTNFF